jgi:hypothetical protein
MGEMVKVVINGCYGGFGVSPEAEKAYAEKKGIETVPRDDKYLAKFHDKPFLSNKETGEWIEDTIENNRSDPALVAVVEELGEVADGFCAALCVVDIPDDVEWQIEDYDGIEWVAEKHRTWRCT